MNLLTGPQIILTLKILVSLVTILLVSSLVALAVGKQRLHGWINRVFFVLTMVTVLAFELLLRLGTDVTSQFSPETRDALRIHLGFSIPAALLLPLMLWSGLRHRRNLHIGVGLLFLVLWIGTFITGVFYLPHN